MYKQNVSDQIDCPVSSKRGLPDKDLPPLADHQPKMVPENMRNPG
ncbi:MAG: hypothetical protein ABGX16_16415 [Pirellulales bacterium]